MHANGLGGVWWGGQERCTLFSYSGSWRQTLRRPARAPECKRRSENIAEECVFFHFNGGGRGLAGWLAEGGAAASY